MAEPARSRGLRRLPGAMVAAAAALLLAQAPAAAADDALSVHRVDSPRHEIAFDSGWRFTREDPTKPPIAPGFDDDRWARVNVPHSWNWIGAYERERDPRTDLSQGIGWYRLHFRSPARDPGARSFVQFDGVGAIADVWLNGHKLGRHAGAFSRFRFDVTDTLAPGDGTNVLVVRADNSKRGPDSSTADVLPLAGDFFIFGGIYRHVSLVTTAAAHIAMLDHAGPGVYATTETVEHGTAHVAVSALVTESDRDAPLAVTLALDDASGRTVASQIVNTAIVGGAGEARADLDVPAAHLWNGRADPYLYRLRAEVRRDGRLTDRVVQPFGIRTVRIDPDLGFFLNGRHLDLHGVSRHQDRYGKGWALSDADQAGDMALIADLGANAIRAAHYQHAPIWYDLADRTGMIVWAEVPFVNQPGWTRAADLDPAIRANAEQQMHELIAQNFNHPSIVTWSAGNETDIVDLGENGRRNSRRLLADLSDLAKRADPGRPTTFADCCEPSDTPADPRATHLAGAADTIGYNRYYGWYYGDADELGPRLDLLHRRHPGLAMAVSEYGAGGAVSQHSDDPRGGLPDSHGLIQPEEYQTWVLARSWAAISARPYLWASWLWTSFDFASPRTEGDSTDLNTKGLVTSDRRIRKDAFYLMRALWSDRPTLRLAEHRYVDRAYPVTDVEVFSNAREARLVRNDVDLGTQPCANGICTWHAVHLDAGANTLVATATIGGRALSDAVTWTAPDPAAGLAIDAGTLLSGQRSGGAVFGSDAFFTGGKPVRIDESSGGGGLDPALAGTIRTGDFRYDLPLPNGRWRLTMWFVDAGPKIAGTFDVLVADKRALSAVAAPSGCRGCAVSRTIPVVVRDGHLRLHFVPRGGPAQLAALTARAEP